METLQQHSGKPRYVFDTSVLIYDPQSLSSFSNSILILPFEVVLELDKLKTQPGEVGQNARIVIREIEKLSLEQDLRAGIVFGGSVLMVSKFNLLEDWNNDRKILEHALLYEGILVSRDINLRLQARLMGLQAQDYDGERKENFELYRGYQEISNPELGQKLKADGFVGLPENLFLEENECVYLKDKINGGVLGRKVGVEIRLISDYKPWGLELKSKEQAMAADLIADPKVSLVSLSGGAGVGKSLVSLACALDLVLEKKQYKKLIVYRPIQCVGKEIGFLPGSMKEKLAPFMEAILDNLEFLLNKRGSKRSSIEEILSSPQYSEKIELSAITYVRGRSINSAIIVIDDAQNLSIEEMKTILTRVGHGSKVVLTFDPQQIDRSDLDADNNGPTYVVEKFRSSILAGHITLSKGLRSELATLAAKIL